MARCLGWPTEPPTIPKYPIPKNNRAMLKALGNSVVPQIVEMIGYAVLAEYWEIDV